MSILSDIQTLEPGALVELFDLDATVIGGDMLRFHGYTQVGSIWWQGNEYDPWPIQAEGFAVQGEQLPTPRLSVGNVDGSITALCLYLEDIVGAKVTRRRTFGRYLDAANFGGVNLEADPGQEFPVDIWYIERKTSETPEVVSFELSSALDFNNVQLPRRQIVANVCWWLGSSGYRGADCGYTGGPVAKADDTATDNPALDRCGGRLSSCKLRFGNGQLPFGSFPAAGLITR